MYNVQTVNMIFTAGWLGHFINAFAENRFVIWDGFIFVSWSNPHSTPYFIYFPTDNQFWMENCTPSLSPPPPKKTSDKMNSDAK